MLRLTIAIICLVLLASGCGEAATAPEATDLGASDTTTSPADTPASEADGDGQSPADAALEVTAPPADATPDASAADAPSIDAAPVVDATLPTAPDGDGEPDGGGQDAGADTDLAAQDADGLATDAAPAVFTLSSSAFVDGGEMPEAHVCCLESPALSWSGAPEGTVSYVLIFDDPDVPNIYDHWAVYNISADVTGLDVGASGKNVEGTLPQGAVELDCGSGFTGYLGPCPPAEHTYRWRLWALSDWVYTEPTTFDDLEAAASEVALGMAEMSNTFGPKTPAQGATCN
ncbi:MAG: YbhB/YbcL family Raf kinase inhibitor-like protein [Myxococcota bacterium]|jgi:hypothetical protein|nr:YbhB/YbcL family Raf kinase inhibitor-like protein [Myxococcota bacterium]